MASFSGSWVSPQANVLFDPIRADAAAQGFQRNQLLADNSRQDQQQQSFQRDFAARQGMARELVALPEQQAAAEWGGYRQRLQAAGLGQGLPEQFPGMERIRAVASSDMSSFQRMQLDQQRQQNTSLTTEMAGWGGGAPAPTGGAPAPAGGGGLSPTLALQRQAESGGNPGARNPRSSATGADQFIDGTWLEYAQANPDRFQGMSREQILARRTDEGESGRASQWYQRENARGLAAAGLPNGPGETTLAHRFGLGGATSLLRSDPNQSIAEVVGPQVMAANPDLAGKTVGQVRGQYQQRYGGTQQAAAEPQPTAGGGVAARTGGTDVAGPGAGPEINPRSGLTQAQERDIQGLQRSGATAEEVRRQIIATRRQNETDATRQRQFDQLHPPAAEGSGPFGGTGIEAQAYNSLLRIGPKIEDGSATPAERQQYALAHGHMTRGTTQLVDDGKGGQVLARIPGVVPEGFPTPSFRPGAPAAADAPAPGAAVPVPGTARAAHPTADQSKVATFAERISAVLPIIEENSAAGAGMTDRAMSHVPVVGGYLTSSAFQKADQAQRDFINAVLRRESGAAISDGEFDNARRQYFPQPGEGADVLKQKKENRERILSGFRREAGPAYQAAPAPSDAPGSDAPAPASGRPRLRFNPETGRIE